MIAKLILRNGTFASCLLVTLNMPLIANEKDLFTEDYFLLKQDNQKIKKVGKAKTEKGDRGDRGEQGLKGEKGSKGDKGDKGSKGDKGDKGEQGLKGDQGLQGEPGLLGPKGDQGPRGIAKPNAYGSYFTLNSLSGFILNSGDLVPFNSSSNQVNIIPIMGGFQSSYAGRYLVTFGIEGLPSTSGISQFTLRKDGRAIPGGTLDYNSGIAVPIMQSISIIIDLIAYQTVDVQYTNDAGETFILISPGTSNTITYFYIEKIR